MAIGADGRWQPGVGDPSIGGWVTVAAYFGASLMAARALRLHNDRLKGGLESAGERPLFSFWLLVACVLLFLGVNKQLDLQSWVTQLGRDLAHAQGWYERRRLVQVLFIAVLGLCGIAGITALAFSLHREIRRVRGALLGLGFLVTFVAVRAASFHHIDQVLGYGMIPSNWVLELTGIALIGHSAWRQGHRGSRTQQA